MTLAGESLTASVLSVGTVAAPLNTTASGTPTSGTTEVFDAILGYYQVTLINGHTYRASVNGLQGSGTVAGDLYNIFIRDSGNSSNPTSASTQIAHSRWYCPAVAGAGQSSIVLAMSFVAAGSGVHTFGVSAARVSGTGVFTPVNTRELLIEDLGGN